MLRQGPLCVHRVHRESMHGSVDRRIALLVRPATLALVSMLHRKDVLQVRTRLDGNNHAAVVPRASNVPRQMLRVWHAALALTRLGEQRVAPTHRRAQRPSRRTGFLSPAHLATPHTHRR